MIQLEGVKSHTNKKLARFHLTLAKKNREEISMFLFRDKGIGTFGQIIYP